MRNPRTAEILEALESSGLVLGTHGSFPATVAGVSDDSRRIEQGDVFIAVAGYAADGHDFIEAAHSRGASMAVTDRPGEWQLPHVTVSDSRRAGVLLAEMIYGCPADELRIAGVTGTNGKSTTVHLARVALDATTATAASLGTLGVLVGRPGRVIPGGAGLTTPGAIELRRVLRRLRQTGVGCVAMEVSSHSLVQQRVDGIGFEAAVFTTFTRDHLDYHGTMDEYFRAKARLIDHLRPQGALIINADESAWTRLPRSHRALAYGLAPTADVRATDVRHTQRGSTWTLYVGSEAAEVRLPLVGDFNVTNALAAAAIASAMGAPVPEIAHALSDAPQVPGRLEVLSDSPLVLRDYAHTPDALERSLRAARRLGRGRLTVVFGCGGDRDRGKRPLMGEVAARLADRSIVTSDNPRTEDPERIIDEIVGGMPPHSYDRIEDRRDAISIAIADAAAEDVVLIAGKGHETYQIRGTDVLPFDEKEIVGELLTGMRS